MSQWRYKLATMASARIRKQDLISELAAGSAAGLTVLTPNRRLAQELAREFNAAQAKKDLAAWETADILPAGAFLERGYEEALTSEGGEGLAQLLAPAQEQALWESVLADSGLLAIPAAAAQCADAWRLAHAWGIEKAIEKFDGGEDSRAFTGWSRDYARRCRDGGFTDAARLSTLGAKLLSRRPKQLVAYGFDILTPQLKAFLELGARESVAIASCGPEPRPADAIHASFASPRHELEAAAQWARARLEVNASARIGVVVPDLQLRRREVVRVFERVMQPAAHLPGTAPALLPFNLSLGAPLADYPVVHAALAILEASVHAVEFERWSRLLRSPFLAGAEAELAARAAGRAPAPPPARAPEPAAPDRRDRAGRDLPAAARRAGEALRRRAEGEVGFAARAGAALHCVARGRGISRRAHRGLGRIPGPRPLQQPPCRVLAPRCRPAALRARRGPRAPAAPLR